MKVSLVSSTMCVSEKISDAVKTAEDLIVYIARVSNPSNQLNVETGGKLLKYLIAHGHWSPFEMVSMCVEIETSRAIAAQILRHRSFSFQEFSQRYAQATELEPIFFREKADKNRQSSAAPIKDERAYKLMNEALVAAQNAYYELLDMGVAKECARMILPMTTQTKVYMSGTVRSWIHYLKLRTQENVQLEHREIAVAIKSIFLQQFPFISEALGWCDEACKAESEGS